MATYYVDTASGNNSNAGTSEGTAWATLLWATMNSGGGDTVYVKNSGVYYETLIHTTTGGGGSSTSPIKVIGYDTTPGDNGRFIIDGVSVSQTWGVLIAGTSHVRIINMEVRNVISHGIYGLTNSNISVQNVYVHDCGGDGFHADDYCFISDSIFEDNTGYGIRIGRYSNVFNCKVLNNGTYGISSNGDWLGNVIFGTLVTGHKTGEIYPTSCYGASVINCTIDGQGNASSSHVGIRTDAGYLQVLNTIIYDCYTGISAGDYYASQGGGNNCYYSNVTDRSGFDTDFYNEGDITSDPLFTDEANGDYTLSSSSPCINAGRDAGGSGMDIGAFQSQDAGTGGGRVILTS